jgi:SecD/SecF fusion protein
MQSRGAIKFFAIIFALVCLFQLSFTFFSAKVERDAREYATNQATVNEAERLAQGDETLQAYYFDSISRARQEYYLDSMDQEIVYNILVKEYTYEDVKERELNLGLDLKGGMNVMLEVSVGEIVEALAGPNSVNPIFQQALSLTYQKQRESQQDFVTLFGEAFEEVDPNAKLASIFNTVDLKDKISYNSTNEEVLEVIRDETDAAFDRTFNILRTRIDRFGVTQPNVQKLAASNRVAVELPGIKEPARVRKLLQGTAKLEFWETFTYDEVYNYFIEANEKLRTMQGAEEQVADNEEGTETGDEVEFEPGDEGAEPETTSIEDQLAQETDTAAGESLIDQIESDTTEAGGELTFDEYAKENPLNAFLVPNYEQGEDGRYYPRRSAMVGYAAIKDTARINRMLAKVSSVFPRNLRLSWTNKPRNTDAQVLELVALKVTSRDGSPALGGEVVVDARRDIDPNGNVEVTLSMNSDGARVWKQLTGENIGRQIAIVLDDYVYSYPNVNQEIPSGRSSISGGDMSIEEGDDLANILKAGKLPAPARIVEEAVVGPSLGQEAINAGMWSFIIAFSLVLIYMVFYYNRAGWVADLALITNIFFLFGVLASLGAVLTLPGIAGIVLTLGMAVDANVIIYERIKEEVRAGKGMRLAISDGYKNAYSAIIDGNVTTLLTGIVLYVFGTGPVQGFATTLIIGILSSLFSAIFISRLIFTWALNKNRKVTFDTRLTRNFLANAKFPFINVRRRAYILSAIIIVIGIGSLFTRGLNLGIDFTGGRTYVVRFDQNVSVADIRDALTLQFDGQTPEVKTFGPNTQVKVTTKYLIDDNDPSVDSIIQTKLYNGMIGFYGDQNISYKQFSSDTEEEGKLLGILSSVKVGPTIADDIRNKAIMAVTFALIVIFVYIAARFRRWQYGLSGVIALFHDSLITISLFSLFYNILPFNMEIDQAFIAAILTIIGYSINDTVIIFDRIREYTGLYPKKDLRTNINFALNSTLARTINTSGTTIVVLLTIFIFGGETIRGFTFALLIGVMVGTYSSLFTASPIAYDLLGGDKLVERQQVKASRRKKK